MNMLFPARVYVSCTSYAVSPFLHLNAMISFFVIIFIPTSWHALQLYMEAELCSPFILVNGIGESEIQLEQGQSQNLWFVCLHTVGGAIDDAVGGTVRPSPGAAPRLDEPGPTDLPM